jgi:Fe-S-cluster containining protein
MLPNEAFEIPAEAPAAGGDEKSHEGASSRNSAAAAIRGSSEKDRWYQCQRCGNCCRWPGFVRLNDADITAISGFLGLDELDFIDRYTRLRPRRDGLALIDKPNGECVFLDGIDCRIQAVKPHQCAGFPNAWNFPGWRDVCEAVEITTGSTIAAPPR